MPHHIRHSAHRPLRPPISITSSSSRHELFFPHFPAPADFSPFFRLLDASDPFTQIQASHRSFTPRFDVREAASAYELQGELPGIKQEDIEIEFVDANTLVIKGSTERSVTKTNAEEKGKAIEQTNVVADDDAASEKSSSSYQRPSVEDDYVDASAEGRDATPSSATVEATPSESKVVAEAPKVEEPQHKYWVSERSVGHFERRFSFPGKVDQDAVKASLKNGVLSIVVPKAAKQERRIAIQ